MSLGFDALGQSAISALPDQAATEVSASAGSLLEVVALCGVVVTTSIGASSHLELGAVATATVTASGTTYNVEGVSLADVSGMSSSTTERAVPALTSADRMTVASASAARDAGGAAGASLGSLSSASFSSLPWALSAADAQTIASGAIAAPGVGSAVHEATTLESHTIALSPWATGLVDVEAVASGIVALVSVGLAQADAGGGSVGDAFAFPTPPSNIAVGSVTASPFAVRVTTGSSDGTGGFGVSLPGTPRNRGGFGIR